MQICSKTAVEGLADLVAAPGFGEKARNIIMAENPFLARKLTEAQNLTGADTVSMPHILYYALREAQIQNGLAMPVVTPQIWEAVIAESYNMKNLVTMIQSFGEKNPHLYNLINGIAKLAPKEEKIYAKIGSRIAFLVYNMLEVAEASEKILSA